MAHKVRICGIQRLRKGANLEDIVSKALGEGAKFVDVHIRITIKHNDNCIKFEKYPLIIMMNHPGDALRP